MNVLIVESKRHLAELWRRALERLGAHVDIASSQDQAADMAAAETYHIVVLDLILDEGSAFAVADFMNYRQPDAQVIFVTNTSFFSDGSIFSASENIRIAMRNFNEEEHDRCEEEEVFNFELLILDEF